jgi:WD40 repeat protein
MAPGTIAQTHPFDDQVFRFESAWQSGVEPDIDTFLGAIDEPSSPSRDDLLAELVLIDIEHRWRTSAARPSRGVDAAATTAKPHDRTPHASLPPQPRFEDYLARFPALRQRGGDYSLELVAQEYRVRHRFGDRPTHKEFLARFPDLAEALVDRLAIIDVELAAERDVTQPLGRLFGHFEIAGVLGEGGMGTVYRARDTRLHRDVALKVIRGGGWATPAEQARFHDEAATVAGLDHPNIVPLYEVGQFEGTPYFSMKLIEGVDLAKVLSNYTADLNAGVRLVIDVAAAVHYAHQRGILHRDLKPGNIVLNAHGQPHVTDFGLAKRLDAETVRTRTGDIVGTPAYMSPEQAAGRKDAATTTADIYGVGAVLYAVLTGHAPFRGTTPLEVQRQVLDTDPRSPRLDNPLVDRDLENICLKCLEKNPGHRYNSAADLADDLRSWLVGEPVRARRISAPARVWRWCRRKPVAAALAAVAGILLLTVAIAAPVIAVQMARLREKDTYVQKLGYFSNINEIRRLRLSEEEGWSQRAREMIREAVNRGVAPERLFEFRSEVVAAHEAIDVRRVAILKGDAGEIESLDFSPDSRTLVTASVLRKVQAWNLAALDLNPKPGAVPVHAPRPDQPKEFAQLTGQGPAPTPGSREAELPFVTFHPSGYFAYSTPGPNVYFHNPADGKSPRPPLVGGAPARSAMFDRTGRRIAVAWSDGHIAVYDTADGKKLRDILVDSANVEQRGEIHLSLPVGLSPDGKRVAVVQKASQGFQVRVHSAQNKDDPSVRIGTHRSFLTALAFSPDGRMLASASKDYSVKLYELAEDESKQRQDAVVQILNQHLGPVHCVTFSPDSQFVATGSEDGTVRLWESRTGRRVRLLHTSLKIVKSIAFSPDGRYLAAGGSSDIGSGAVVVYELSLRWSRQGLVGHLWTPVTGLAIHPTQSLFVTAAGDHEILFWKIGHPRFVRELNDPSRKANVSVSFSPGNGDWLAVAPFDVIEPREKHLDRDYAVDLWRWESDPKSPVRRLTGHRDNVQSHAFDENGERLASGAADGTVIVWRVSDGVEHFRVREPHGSVRGVAFIDKARQLLSAHADGHLVLRQVADNSVTKTSDLPLKTSASIVTHDQRVLVLGCEDGKVRFCRLPELELIEDTPPVPEIVHPISTVAVSGLAASRDGRWLATSSDRQIVVWDLMRREPLFELPPQDALVYRLEFDHAADRLLVCCHEDIVTLWDLRPLRKYLAEFDLD